MYKTQKNTPRLSKFYEFIVHHL